MKNSIYQMTKAETHFRMSFSLSEVLDITLFSLSRKQQTARLPAVRSLYILLALILDADKLALSTSCSETLSDVISFTLHCRSVESDLSVNHDVIG